ncbi:hypothetical protein JHK82_034773 [Glycine max]|nr:hypothetical protein JHK82_034773 [Glycine max]
MGAVYLGKYPVLLGTGPNLIDFHSLFINCGGPETKFEGNEYEADLSPLGISNYVPGNSGKWAYSSTGVYLGNAKADYIATNQLSLDINGPDYYHTARIAPLYLNYYGLCMLNGNYKVKLHFAEIAFSDDQSYCNLGKRVFDVSIQHFHFVVDFKVYAHGFSTEQLLELLLGMCDCHIDALCSLEDGFPLSERSNRPRDLNCGNFKVTENAHLVSQKQFSDFSLGKRVFDVSIQGFKYLKDFNIAKEAGGVGKGITREFNVNVTESTLEIHLSWAGKGTNAIPIIGVYGPLISAITVTPKLLGLKTGYFSLRQIKAATNNFDPANKIGEGGFGPVFKVNLIDYNHLKQYEVLKHWG